MKAGPHPVSPACPLCTSSTRPHHSTPQRSFRHCPTCELVHVPARYHLDAEAERAEYDLHENDPSDQGYRRFLNRAVAPLLATLDRPSTGLDFGCGPGPTVSHMLRAAGHQCADYDPFYRDDPSLLERRYDFVVTTEVAEHLRTPAATLERLFGLAPTIVMMTKRTRGRAAFAGWHYHRDPTHIVFYADATMRWLAERYDRHLTLPSPDVALFAAG